MAGTKKSDPPAPLEVGDIVLAKVKGYPPWPGRVTDPDSVPEPVKKDRPKGTKTVFYCVCFFPTGDFAWQVQSGISKLQKHEIEAYISEPTKKNGELLNGYKVALDPSEWDKNRAEGLKAAADAQANASVDELDDDSESGKSKKRKRTSDAGEDKKKTTEKKKAAAAKTAKGKADVPAATKGKKRGKKNGATSSEMIAESEDEGEAKKDDERPSKKAKGDEDEEDDEHMSEDAKMVKGWRHELQRVFLNKSNVIKPEDMEKASAQLKVVEDFGSKMTVTLLSSSKIGKVIKKMSVLSPSSIPNDDEYKFIERSNTLLSEWSKIAAPNTNGDANPAPEVADVTTGDVTMADIDAPAEPDTSIAAPVADTKMKVDPPAEATPAPAVESAPAPAEAPAAEPAPVTA